MRTLSEDVFQTIIGRIDAVLADNVYQINKRDTMAAITGNLSETIKTRLENAKAKAANANAGFNKAIDSIEAAVVLVEKQAADAEAEAAQIQAAVGLTTNGPPA